MKRKILIGLGFLADMVWKISIVIMWCLMTLVAIKYGTTVGFYPEDDVVKLFLVLCAEISILAVMLLITPIDPIKNMIRNKLDKPSVLK